MRASWMTWVFAALFLLLGLPLAVISDPLWQRIFGGLCTVSLGCFAVSMSADAMRQGSLRLQHSVISRAARPRLFAATTAGIALCGLFVIGIGIWALFLK